MSKEKIRKLVTDNQKKILAILVILIAIFAIIGITAVNASKNDDYAVEIKDDGSKNIATNLDYDSSNPKVYDSSITKKIVADTPQSLTYEVQVKNLAPNTVIPEVAIVIDSSRSMGINDIDNAVKGKAIQLINELRANSPKTKISISTNSGVKLGQTDWQGNATQQQQKYTNMVNAINGVTFSDGQSVANGIDYATSTFTAGNEGKYLVIFSDATDSVKEKLEGLTTDRKIGTVSVLTDITNNEYQTSTLMGTSQMISDTQDFSNVWYKTNSSIINVKLTDVFSSEVNEYFDFEEVSKDNGLEMEKTSNGYILKCNEIKAGETKTYKFTLTLKDSANINAQKTYAELSTSDSLTIEYKDSKDQSHTYEMKNTPTFVICKKYSLTIKAVSEKSDSLPVTDLDIKVVGTTVVGQDEFGIDIVKEVFNDTLKTNSRGEILIDDLKTLGDITFEIKPLVNQFGYQETSATEIIVHNDPTGVGTIWAESDVTNPEVDVVKRNITVLLPISVETFDMEIIATDANDSNIFLGNTDFRLIQPKLNSKYNMEAIYGTTNSDGKLILKPAIMTKDGSYQYILSQMSTQEGYDSMGNVTLIVTFENGKVTSIAKQYNDLVTTDHVVKDSNKTVVRVGNVCQTADSFKLEINLKDKDTGNPLFGGIYDIEVNRTTSGGEQVTSKLNGYITDANGKISIEVPGTGYINLKIKEREPKAGYVADEEVKNITFFRNNGTVQYISSKAPASLDAIPDSDNNKLIVNLTSQLANEQNRIQVQLVDNEEITANIPGVLLGINKVGEEDVIQGITNQDGIADFIVPNESKGKYKYEIKLISSLPGGYVATSQVLGVIEVEYGNDTYIIDGTKVSTTTPYLDVTFNQSVENDFKYDTAKVEIRIAADPTYAYKFKIALVDDTNKPVVGAKYSIQMESDGVEVKYLSGKLTDTNGNYTTRIVGGGQNITIRVTETATLPGYVITQGTKVIELELVGNQYVIMNSTDTYDPANGGNIGPELVGKDVVYHDLNKSKTGANTILNLYINKMDQNDALVSGVKVKISSPTLLRADGSKLDDMRDILDDNGNVIGQRNYFVTDQNGYFEELAIKVQGDKLDNGERIDYLYMNELDADGNVIPNTDLTIKLTFRLNKITNVVEITNVEATWGNRLVKDKTYSARETDVAYENDVHLDLFTNFDDVGNFSIDLKKVNKDGKKLLSSKYDIVVIRPDGTTLVRRDITVNDSVELDGILVSKGTKIEITEKEAPIGYNINKYTEVLTITEVDPLTNLVTYELEPSLYQAPRARMLEDQILVATDGTQKLCTTIELTDYELDTFKFGITAKDGSSANPVAGYQFTVSSTEGAQKNFAPTDSQGRTSEQIGANYKIDGYEVTYTIKTYREANYYKKLSTPIEVKVVFDLNGNLKGAETIAANQTAPGYGTIWSIQAVNTVGGNDIDVEIKVDPCDPLTVNIKTKDTVTNNEITTINYQIVPSINLPATGNTQIKVGYVLPGGVQTYTIKQTNVIGNYKKIPDQQIKITYTEEGNVLTLDELTNEVHEVSINGKEVSIIIDAEPEVPFTMKNTAYFHPETNIVNSKFIISVADDINKEMLTDTLGEDEIYSGKFETDTSKIYTVKQTNAGTGYAKVKDFQIEVFFDGDKNITDAKIVNDGEEGNVNEFVEFVTVSVTRPSTTSDRGYNGNDKGIVNITVKSYPQVEFSIENVDRRDETIKLAGTKYKVESRLRETSEIYTSDEEIITGNDGIGTAKLDKSGYRNNVIYTITELQPSARYQTLGIEPEIDVEFNELGYIINATINKRDDVIEVVQPTITTPEDNFKLHIKIKNNPELKINITKVDEEDESVVIPGVNFELTARILKDNLSSEEQEKLTLNTAEQTEEYYLSQVLDRLQITREEVEAIKKNIGITNIIESLKNNGNLSTEEEDEINLQLNDNLKINKIVELGKLTKTQVNQRIASVSNRATINRLIQENKTTEDTVNDLLEIVEKQVRLDVDRVVTDQNGKATLYMDKTLANKTIEYTLKETKKAAGYDWLDYVVIFEVTYDANGMMVSDNPIRKVSGNMDITSFNQYNFEISTTVKNTPSKEFQIHLSVEDVYDSNKKLETAKFDAYLVDTQNSYTYAPDNEYRVALETGSVTTGTNLVTAHGEDTEVVGLYDKGAGRRILRLVQKQAPSSYYLGTDKYDSEYQSIQYALLIDVEFNDEGNIVATNLHSPGGDSNQIGYIADGRYLQVSHTKNTINVTVRYYPMLQVQMQAKDMYTGESLQGNYTIDTRMWNSGSTPPSAIVSAGYINPHYTSYWIGNVNYGYQHYGRTYSANYVTSNAIRTVDEAARVAIAPTEPDTFAENKNPNKANDVRRLYVYENAEPNAPIQYQTYLPRHITHSSNYLLAIIDVKYDALGQVETVNVMQENSQMNITSGFFKSVKANVNEHTIKITVDYAPITTINATVIDEVSGTGLSGIRVQPYLGGTNVTNTSYEYRTTMYYTTNSQGKTGWTYWGASVPDTLNRYIIDTYTQGSGYEGYFDPGNVILDVAYDEYGRISGVTPMSTDAFGDVNAIGISWVNNNINVTIRYSRKFNVKLNKVDFYDSNKKLNAAFSIVTSEGTNASMAANTVTTLGKVYAGKTVKYTLSETAVPAGYIPIENMEIMVDFNNNGSIRNANSTSEYFEFVKSAPVDLGTNSLKKTDLEANIKNKPRFDITIELSDKFYPSLKLEGGTFEITNSKGDIASGGIQTDVNGIIQTYIGTVYPNEDVLYTIKQTNTITGYQTNNSIVTFNVHFNSNGKIENYNLIGGTDVATMHPTKYIGTKEVKLDITNIPKDIRLGIYKHDKLDNSPMSDVSFKLTTKEEGKLDSEKTVVTNANGTAIDVVDEFKQTTGANRVVTYVISEIEAAPSYRKIQPVEIKVTYKSDGTMYLYDVVSNPSNVIVEVATNKQIKYVDNTPVHIKLTIPNDNAYDLIVKNEDKNYSGLGIFGTTYNVTINGIVQSPITTNANGIAKIMNQTQTGEITIGIAENTIGEGYREDNNNVTTIKVNKGTGVYSLEFVDNSNPTYAIVEVNEEYGTITVTFKNETKLELTMQKDDINTGAVLEGAEFEIVEEELDNTGAVVEGTRRVITTSENNTTDVNGLLYFDLGLSKQNKTIRYTFTETNAPVGYTQIHPITVTVKFNIFGHIAQMTDDSFRAEETLTSNTGRSHHMIVVIGNGTVNEAYTVKIVTEDSQSGRRINGSIFQVEAIETANNSTNKSVTGATTDISTTLAGSTYVYERGALKVGGITAEGDVQIKFKQIESAVGYVYGENPTTGIVNIHTEFEIIPSTQEKQVTITEGAGNDERFDVQIDDVNRVITIKVLNDPQVNFEITKVDRDTEEPIQGMKFNVTSTVIDNGQSTATDLNKDFSPTDALGYTESDVGYSYDTKTVVYTITEEKDLQYRALDPVVIAVRYDTSGNITSYQILSNTEDVTIKEDDTKTISKRVLSDSSPLIGIVDINYSTVTIPTGIGSRILQLEIKNSKEPSDYRIQIGKYHEDTTYPYLLPGAKYEITVVQEHGKASTTWEDITDENGIILSPYFNGYGDIEISIKELEAPEGFKKDEVTKTTRIKRYESSGKIVIHSTDVGAKVSEDNTTVYLEVSDKQLSGLYDIIVNKIDAKTGSLIEKNPATIKLQLAEEIETITQTIDPDTGDVIENITTAEVITPIFEENTDDYGRIVAKNLNAPTKPGVYKYILSETNAPKDYEGISENQVEILVTFDLNDNQEMIITNVAVNGDVIDVKAGKTSNQIMNIIVYNTLDEEGSSTLADDEFGIDLRKVDADLYQITGSIAKFELLDLTTNEVKEVETDELGRSELIKYKIPESEGQYQLVLSETKAPIGYKPLEGNINILLDFAKDEDGKIYLSRANVVGDKVVYANKAQDGELPDRKLQLKVINEDGPYTLIIEKRHIQDPYYPDFIPGVKFDIKITPEFGGEVLDTDRTTDENGIIKIEDLEGYGRIKIEITEVSAPDQYKADYETKHLEFYRDKYTKELREYDSNVHYEFDHENQIVYMRPVNEIKSGLYDMVINKVDKNTNKTITSDTATFNVNMIKKYYKNNIETDENGNEVNVPEITEIKIPIIENESTNGKGYLTKNFVEMPTEPGTYTFELEEVKAPSGYEKIENVIKYEVTLEENDKGEIVITNVNVLNDDKNLQVLTWKDQFIAFSLLNQNGIPDGKVQFQVNKVDEEGNSITTDTAVFKIVDRKTNEVYYMETDVNSSIAEKLIDMPKEAGKYNYTINEIKAPEGYALDRNDINLELEYTEDSNEEGKIILSKVTVNGENVEYTNEAQDGELPNRNIALKMTNKLGQNGSLNDKTYTVIVNKIDEVTREHILDRATFDVALVNGEIVHASTNEEGQMIIENVHMPATPGDYEVIVKETKAPEGYILDDEMKIVNVTFSGLAQNMIISNLALGTTNNTNIEIVTAECTEDTIVLNVLNKAEDDPLYVVSKKYENGEVIYDLMDSYEGKIPEEYKLDKPFIDTKVAKSGNNITIQEFIDNLDSNGILTVWDKEGNKLDPSKRVATGMILKANKGNEEMVFDIVVKGDADGDGRVRSKDGDRLVDHMTERDPMTDPLMLRAIDLNNDGRIRGNDLTMLQQDVLAV